MSRINVNEIVGVGNTHVQILSGLIGDASQLTFPPNIVSFSPAYLEDAAEVNTNIVFTFNQPIMFRGTGSVILRSGSPTGSVVQTFSITDGSPGSGLSIVTSSQLVINPSSDLSYDTQYYVELNTNPGIANTHGAYYKGDNTYNFKTKLIPFTATGGNYTYTKYDSGSPTNYYKYHIFTGSGPLQLSHPSSQAVDLDWMLVAGGGTGGSAYSPHYQAGGGGGAGGVLTGTGPTMSLGAGSHTVTIGAGGGPLPASNQPSPSYNGNPSTVGSNQALGGGNGGGYPSGNDTARSGKPGGCGGAGTCAPQDYPGNSYRGGTSPTTVIGQGTPGQGNPGGRGGFQLKQNPGSLCYSGGGGGGAGGSGGNSTYPNYPTPGYPGYPGPTWNGWNMSGGDGGAGKPNPAFGSGNIAGYVPESVFPLNDLLNEVQSNGYYGGGGGGGATMQPSDYYGTRSGNGGVGGGGHGGGAWTNPPTGLNPSPFMPEWPAPSPQYQYARPGHQYLGGGGGGAQGYPNNIVAGQGGSGCFMLRYAVPGD